MANKYGIYGAAFNGDGTASNEAASDGAAGAWKLDQAAGDIVHGGTPTYGSLSPGDVVYIRSKTGNGADANKTFTVTANQTIGNSAATAETPIIWVLDNGVTWSGINGVLEWECNASSVSVVVAVRDYNGFVALEPEAFFVDYNVADPVTKRVVVLGTGSYIKNWNIDAGAKTGSFQCTLISMDNGSVAENPKVVVGRLTHPAIVCSAGAHAFVINPTVELVGTTNNISAVFSSNHSSNRGGKMTIIGGLITGPAADDGDASLLTASIALYAFQLEVYGTNFPKQMPFADPSVIFATHPQQCFCIGSDGNYGSAMLEPWGLIDSRNLTYNYPTLSATVPDSVATPWSWRLYPKNASRINPAVVRIAKVYQNAADTKTVTLEMLTSDTWAADALNTHDIWMSVTYVNDADDSCVTETTRAMFGGTALDTSSAGWDKNDWGSMTLDKKKLSLTTTNDIKQNSMIEVLLFWNSNAGSINEQAFICPDVQLT